MNYDLLRGHTVTFKNLFWISFFTWTTVPSNSMAFVWISVEQSFGNSMAFVWISVEQSFGNSMAFV
jgi:hypothetical protein